MRSSAGTARPCSARLRSPSRRPSWARDAGDPHHRRQGEIRPSPRGRRPAPSSACSGKGIPVLNGRGRGDQYVTVNIETPRNLNREQKEALKKFSETLGEGNYEKHKQLLRQEEIRRWADVFGRLSCTQQLLAGRPCHHGRHGPHGHRTGAERDLLHRPRRADRLGHEHAAHGRIRLGGAARAV